MIDARDVNVDFITPGKYSSPADPNLNVVECITPKKYKNREKVGMQIQGQQRNSLRQQLVDLQS